MNVNLELHYLASFGYLDRDNVMKYQKKAELNQNETLALQTYASWTGNWANSENRKGGFTNKETYDLYTEAKVCKWYECFTPRELEEIKKFLKDYGYEQVLQEIPN